ncbi:AAA family ATPase [Pseudomonas solani]|uniref:AAA family ATPase n=1 Tax=Pseudomonas solani TaxID=2731552 RepID=UPI002235C796|nr:AAA family ATPase [Pseudomonas solani]
MPDNNTWHQYNEHCDTGVIFVHGFFSSTNSCWMNPKNKIFWPDILKTDSRIPEISIFLGGYFTDVDSGSYGIRECANELFDSLRRKSSCGKRAPIELDKIIFVCHSLGGIVVRYMLESYREYFAGHKIGLALLASPSIGSDYADRLSKLASFYKNRTGKQLKKNSEILSDLDGRFKSFLEKRELNSFFGAEAVEHVGFFHMRWLPGFEPIVLHSSASRYFPNTKIIPKTNHSTIVKPTSINHGSHIFLVDFLNNIFFPKAGFPEHSTPPTPKNDELTKHGPLFDIYDINCEPFYLTRDIDNEISLNLSLTSFWLFGPSGSGKTSMIKRLLAKDAGESIEMCFSQCLTGDFRQAFLTEMIETIHISNNDYEKIPERTFNNLVRMISESINAQKSLYIYIDEVPSTSNEASAETQLSLLIEDLLTSVKQLSQANNFRFIISSLGKPDFKNCRNLSKLNNYLRVIECRTWSESELQSLTRLITDNLESLHPEDLPENLAQLAHGSPRFLKTFLRTKLLKPNMSNEDLLTMSAHGLQL